MIDISDLGFSPKMNQRTYLPPRSIPIKHFIYQLHQILKTSEACVSTQLILHWNDQGNAFVIENSSAFMGLYHSHVKSAKFTSFVRQLNLYRFQKLRSSKNIHIFMHQYFIRGSPEHLEKIRRKMAKHSKLAIAGKDVNAGLKLHLNSERARLYKTQDLLIKMVQENAQLSNLMEVVTTELVKVKASYNCFTNKLLKVLILLIEVPNRHLVDSLCHLFNSSNEGTQSTQIIVKLAYSGIQFANSLNPTEHRNINTVLQSVIEYFVQFKDPKSTPCEAFSGNHIHHIIISHLIGNNQKTTSPYRDNLLTKALYSGHPQYGFISNTRHDSHAYNSLLCQSNSVSVLEQSFELDSSMSEVNSCFGSELENIHDMFDHRDRTVVIGTSLSDNS